MLNILFAAGHDRWPDYEPYLTQGFADAGLQVHLAFDLPPAQVDYIIYAPDSDLKDLTPYVNCKGVLSVWAGAEAIIGNKTITQPLCRMVDDEGLAQGMVEWVTGHVLRHHLGMDRHIINPDNDWICDAPPLAQQRKVTVLGLGELGQACAKMLAHIGFQVSGWSRNLKFIDGISCHAGEDGLKTALTDAEIVVLLLPATAATENVLNSDTLSLLAKGAFVINPGRGPLIDDDALLAALDSGQVGHATLDVFRVEPLPQDHPYWAHPNVTVTPHLAADTRPATAAKQLVANITGHEAGEPLRHVVDRNAGY